MLIEACVDTVASARQAEAGGADRIELCDNLADGGTTPSHATIATALAAVAIPVFPIIRPRGGGFVYSEEELAITAADLLHARDLGAPGAVIGALTSTGEVDRPTIGALRDLAPDLQLTFHRAFDVCRDPHSALEALIAVGIDRILTSGQRATAWEGRALLADLVRQAGERIVIMAGGDVDESNAVALVQATGVTELHVRCTTRIEEPMVFHDHPVPFRRALPADERTRSVTNPARIQALRTAISKGR